LGRRSNAFKVKIEIIILFFNYEKMSEIRDYLDKKKEIENQIYLLKSELNIVCDKIHEIDDIKVTIENDFVILSNSLRKLLKVYKYRFNKNIIRKFINKKEFENEILIYKNGFFEDYIEIYIFFENEKYYVEVNYIYDYEKFSVKRENLIEILNSILLI